MSRILVIDDEDATIDKVEQWLRPSGHEIVRAHSGETGLETARREKPDLIILDILFPRTQMQGDQVLIELIHDDVTADIPIIIFTQKADDHWLQKKILGETDAFIIAKRKQIVTWDKIELEELEAKVKRLLWRSTAKKKSPKDLPIRQGQHELKFGDGYMEVWLDGRHVAMTPAGAQLLRILSENRGKALKASDLGHRLAKRLSYKDTLGEETIRENISRLRRKIEPEPAVPVFLVTVPGFGYMLVEGDTG